MSELEIFCRLESVEVDADGCIHITLSKRSGVEKSVKLLRLYVGEETYILVRKGLWGR